MKINEFIKKELSGWKNFEVISLCVVILLILFNYFVLKDNLAAVISAICGILYTTIAGKGKISCYFFGLCGSGCYSWMAYSNALWGNLILYLCYYIPMQVLGIFKWRKHLNSNSGEIIKNRLSSKERLKFLILSVVGCRTAIIILTYLNDKSPVFDGITSFLSILGMYFTVRRCIEQWFVWIVVNGLSFVMWLNLVLKGTAAYSTLVMWGVYFILAVYFYYNWNKDLEEK